MGGWVDGVYGLAGPVLFLPCPRKRENTMKILIVALIIGSSLIAVSQSERATPSNSIKPPFNLSISSKSPILLGEPVHVWVRLANTSSHEINGSTANIKGFCPQYLYDVRDQTGNKLEQKQVDPTHQASVQIIKLKPGQSRDEATNISETYDLPPGEYTVQLAMPVSYDPGADVVKSNKIMVTITP